MRERKTHARDDPENLFFIALSSRQNVCQSMKTDVNHYGARTQSHLTFDRVTRRAYVRLSSRREPISPGRSRESLRTRRFRGARNDPAKLHGARGGGGAERGAIFD